VNRQKAHQWNSDDFFRPARLLFEKQADTKNDDENAETVRDPEIEEAPITQRVPTAEEQWGVGPGTERAPESALPNSDVMSVRESVTSALEEKDRRIAELEALLAAQKEKRKMHLRAKDLKYGKRERKKRKQHEVALKNAERMGLIDTLTGLHNRKSLFEEMEREISDAIRHNRNLSVLFIDLDRFKAINDHLGHDAGDEALRKASQIVQEAIRPEDRKFRYGGEELVIILTNTDQEGARATAERLRLAFEKQLLEHLRTKFPGRIEQINKIATLGSGTASIGIKSDSAANLRNEMGPESQTGPSSAKRYEQVAKAFIHEADLAAYEAKKRGRNRTAMYGENEGLPKAEVSENLVTRALRNTKVDKHMGDVLRIAEEAMPDSEMRERVLREAADYVKREREAGGN